MEFGEGDATKQKSVKRSAFALNEDKAFKRFGTSGWKIGAPQNAKSNHDGSNTPFSALGTS